MLHMELPKTTDLDKILPLSETSAKVLR